MNNSVSANTREKIKKDRWENYEYSPASQPVGAVSQAIGLALRGLCVAMLVFGLLLFFADAFSLQCGIMSLLFKAVYCTAVFSLIMTGGKKGALIGILLGAAAVVLMLIMHSGLFRYLYTSILCTFDWAMELLVKYGFENYSLYVTDTPDLGLSPKELHNGAMTVICLALSLIFSVFTMRKTVLIPTLLISLGILVLGFTFNLSNSNWGFAFTLLALCGIIVMRVFDRYFKAKRKDRLRVASLGGYAGGMVMLLALIAALIPAITVTKQWSDIPLISKPINVARDVVDSVISGDAPNLKDMGVIKNMDDFNSRDTTPKKQTFSGETLITVETSYEKDIPLHLRSWIATSFDGKAWTTVTNEKRAEYLNKFGSAAQSAGYGDGAYSADHMTNAFYEMIDPELLHVDIDKGYTNQYDSGFISLYLNIKLKVGSGMGNMLFIPAVPNSEGLLAQGELDRPYKKKYTSYFDGMYITGWLNMRRDYSVRAYAPIMSSETFGSELDAKLNYFYAMRELIKWYESGEYNASYKDAKTAEVLTAYGREDLIGSETYFDVYTELSVENRDTAYNKYVTLTERYTEYAHASYGKDTLVRPEIVKTLADRINAQLEEDASTHNKVLSVVEYLRDNYKFTNSPEQPKAYSGFDAFLLEPLVGGNSVQFATAAALILREMGITARYVEGYIALDFKSPDNRGEEDSELYVCQVSDHQAHAWVEVYYDGYGWMPYEFSPQYLRAYYGSALNKSEGSPNGSTGIGGSSSSGDAHAPETDETPLPVPDIPVDTAEPFPAKQVILTVIVIAALIAVGYITFKRLRDRSDSVLAERKRLINDAINGKLDDGDMSRSATEINSEILNMFSIGGCPPNVGELPLEYAKRIEDECLLGRSDSFSEIMRLMQKQEFGHGVSKAELSVIAEYLDELWRDVYRSKNKAKQLWYRYIRCEL